MEQELKKIYIKYERGGKVPEMGAEEDAAMLALRKRLERWKQSAWEAECAIFGREDAAVSGSGSGPTVQNQSENDAEDPESGICDQGMQRGMNFI